MCSASPWAPSLGHVGTVPGWHRRGVAAGFGPPRYSCAVRRHRRVGVGVGRRVGRRRRGAQRCRVGCAWSGRLRVAPGWRCPGGGFLGFGRRVGRRVGRLVELPRFVRRRVARRCRWECAVLVFLRCASGSWLWGRASRRASASGCVAVGRCSWLASSWRRPAWEGSRLEASSRASALARRLAAWAFVVAVGVASGYRVVSSVALFVPSGLSVWSSMCWKCVASSLRTCQNCSASALVRRASVSS